MMAPSANSRIPVLRIFSGVVKELECQVGVQIELPLTTAVTTCLQSGPVEININIPQSSVAVPRHRIPAPKPSTLVVLPISPGVKPGRALAAASKGT